MKTRLGKCYAMEAYGTIYIKTSTLMSLQRRAVKDENKTSWYLRELTVENEAV
jgi:hypothetical protein